MKTLTKTNPVLPLASGLLTGAAIALLMLNSALSVAQGAEQVQKATPQQTGDRTAGSDKQGGEILHELEIAQRDLEQADSSEMKQVWQKTEAALKDAQDWTEHVAESSGDASEESVQQLQGDIKQALDQVHGTDPDPQKVAATLQDIEKSVREVGPQAASAGAAAATAQSGTDGTQAKQSEPVVNIQQGEPKAMVMDSGEAAAIPERDADIAGAEPRMDGALVAQTGEQPQDMQKSDEPTMGNDADKVAPGGKTALSEEKLVGKEVHTIDGENVGEVEKAVMSGGDVNAVLVDVGGFLGIGEKRVAIPVEELSMDGEDLTVGMTKDEVEQLPEYQE